VHIFVTLPRIAHHQIGPAVRILYDASHEKFTRSRPAPAGAAARAPHHRRDPLLVPPACLTSKCARASQRPQMPAMVLPALLALALAACSPAAEAARSSSFDVHGTVEHLVAPLGIATLRPRFSWTLSGGGEGGGGSPRNLSQVGYSLRVGSCSSGDVASAASSLLECSSAEALQPGRAYTWTVTVKLSDGSAATMPPQRFSTGLQARSDWHPSAEFIGLKPLPDAAAVAADGSSGAKNFLFWRHCIC
jgi:hypothetical protein